jgi:hypothetical protein
MLGRLLSTMLAALAIASADAAIDFAPAIEEYSNEGFLHRKVTFKAENGIVTFLPPYGWAVRGSQGQAQLTPPDRPFAEATITAAPAAGPQTFDEATIAALEQQVLASVPPASQSLQVVKRQENPVIIGSNLSFEIVISYAVLGKVFERSVIFVNTPGTQVVFRFTAPKPDFPALHEGFRRSINSWDHVETKRPGTTAIARSVEAPAVVLN